MSRSISIPTLRSRWLNTFPTSSSATTKSSSAPTIPENPAFRLQVKNKATGEDAKLWLFPAYGETAQGQKTNYSFPYRDMQMGYFTGLEVSHEPGQWLVWAGCLLMGAGLFVAFYMVHMRLWVVGCPRCQGQAGAVDRRPGQQEQRPLRTEVQRCC